MKRLNSGLIQLDKTELGRTHLLGNVVYPSVIDFDCDDLIVDGDLFGVTLCDYLDQQGELMEAEERILHLRYQIEELERQIDKHSHNHEDSR